MSLQNQYQNLEKPKQIVTGSGGGAWSKKNEISLKSSHRNKKIMMTTLFVDDAMICFGKPLKKKCNPIKYLLNQVSLKFSDWFRSSCRYICTKWPDKFTDDQLYHHIPGYTPFS